MRFILFLLAVFLKVMFASGKKMNFWQNTVNVFTKKNNPAYSKLDKYYPNPKIQSSEESKNNIFSPRPEKKLKK